MRAPYQILALPYKITDDGLRYCIFRRADHDQWQFVAGGGEDEETPDQAAKREIFEEIGFQTDRLLPLKSMCYLPVDIYPQKDTYNWPEDTYVVPEYAFGFLHKGEIILSHEHCEYRWLKFEDAQKMLQWDSNRTALYELNCRLKENNV